MAGFLGYRLPFPSCLAPCPHLAECPVAAAGLVMSPNPSRRGSCRLLHQASCSAAPVPVCFQPSVHLTCCLQATGLPGTLFPCCSTLCIMLFSASFQICSVCLAKQNVSSVPENSWPQSSHALAFSSLHLVLGPLLFTLFRAFTSGIFPASLCCPLSSSLRTTFHSNCSSLLLSLSRSHLNATTLVAASGVEFSERCELLLQSLL